MSARSALAEFKRRYAKKMAPVINELTKRIKWNTPDDQIVKIVDDVFNQFKVAPWIQRELMFGVGVSTGLSTTSLTFNASFLDRTYKSQFTTFSGRTTDGTAQIQKTITDTIKTALRDTVNLKKVAQDINNLNFTKADLPKSAKELIKLHNTLGRNIGDAQISKEFEKQANKLLARAASLKNTDTSALAQAYRNLANLTDASTEKTIDRAIKYASFHKAKVNAERIARTEFASAQAQSFFAIEQQNDLVSAWRWRKSSSHVEPDICDFNSGADLYGLGAGVYPIDKGPTLPAHPNCMCEAIKVLIDSVPKDKATAANFNNQGAIKRIKAMPSDMQQAFLGKDGVDAFRQDPNSWTAYARGYTPHESKIQVNPLYTSS
jgi:hypothetical protein